MTEDLSDSQSEFLVTVSQLPASTKADDTVRVSEWVNISPVATAREPTNAGTLYPNAVTVTTAAENSVNSGAPTTTPTPSFPLVTPVALPTAPTTNNVPLVTEKSSIVYLPNTGHVQDPQSTTTPQRKIAPSVTATASAPLATATSFPFSTVTVPASHLLPNFSTWTFPKGPSNQPVTATPVTTNHTVFPKVLPATSVAPTASPILPVTVGGTVYYFNPMSLTTVPAPINASVPTTFPAIPSTTTPFAPPPLINAP